LLFHRPYVHPYSNRAPLVLDRSDASNRTADILTVLELVCLSSVMELGIRGPVGLLEGQAGIVAVSQCSDGLGKLGRAGSRLSSSITRPLGLCKVGFVFLLLVGQVGDYGFRKKAKETVSYRNKEGIAPIRDKSSALHAHNVITYLAWRGFQLPTFQ